MFIPTVWYYGLKPPPNSIIHLLPILDQRTKTTWRPTWRNKFFKLWCLVFDTVFIALVPKLLVIPSLQRGEVGGHFCFFFFCCFSLGWCVFGVWNFWEAFTSKIVEWVLVSRAGVGSWRVNELGRGSWSGPLVFPNPSRPPLIPWDFISRPPPLSLVQPPHPSL
jgi:hypothetical protein